MLQYLEPELLINLHTAKSVSIAVALIKDYGLNLIENNLPDNCNRKYLVGIHLPTPPNILRRLLGLQQNNPGEVEVKVYDSMENFHPKVYLIEKKDGELLSFIGSANATRGGFTNNIEMNVSITKQDECLKLQEWFDTLFNSATQFDNEYINRYETIYKRNKALASTQKSNTAVITGNASIVPGNNLVVEKGQFFRQYDFDAFSVPTQFDTSSSAVELRAEVKERLIELSKLIINSFPAYDITNLHLPYRRNLYTSQHFHSRGNVHIPKESIWLNFGKSPSELNNYDGDYVNFVNHLRIQVILRNTASEAYIGIWLYVGKHKFSHYERKKLKEGLINPNFVERLFGYFLALGNAYWISLGDDYVTIADLGHSKDLVDFLSKDNGYEFIIGRNYHPNDADLSEENIAETVLIEFSKLYKIYDLIKDVAPVKNISK